MPTSAAAHRPTRATILATLGPATDAPGMIDRLIEAGVGLLRLNFSHGSPEEHERRLTAARRAAADAGRPVGILGDLPGPKIRIARVPPGDFDGGLVLEPGQEVVFVPAECDARVERRAGGTVAVLGVTYPEMVREVAPGERVLINDGAVRMLAMHGDGAELVCRVTAGGVVTGGKGINLPDTDISAPAITGRDWEWVGWAVRHDVDFLALSFVRRAAEVLRLKERLGGMCPVHPHAHAELGSTIPIVAKIEKPQALKNLQEIVEAADAVMVARGDLGVEMELARVPVEQKRIVAACADWGKPCIVATQMLESMIASLSPTRAEASDVANAIFEGAGAVMLSGETAVGRHPDLAVATMRRIVAAAEGMTAETPRQSTPPRRLVESGYRTAALAHGAWHIAADMRASLVACWSQGGGTARYLSQNDLGIPIIAYSSDDRATRRMTLLRGVTPLLAEPPAGLAEWTTMVERDLLARAWAARGERIILLAGTPLGRAKATNSIAVLTVGDPSTGYRGM